MLKPSSDKPKVDLLSNKLPIVVISKLALNKMKVYIDECSEEVGWLGTAHKYNNAFIIDDVMLFDQEVHSTTTEITPEGLSEFGEELLAKENGIEIWNSIKVWGHSHVNMSTFSSAQDDSQMKVFSDCGHDFFIRIIGNKKDDLRIDLYNYETGVIYNFLPWIAEKTQEEYEIETHIKALQEEIDMLEVSLEMSNIVDEKLEEEIKKDIKSKVKTKSAVTYYSGYKNYSDYNDYKDYKKKEETKETQVEYYASTNLYVEDFILQELTDCYTVADAEYILEVYGYGDGYFSDLETRRLMKLARDTYGGEGTCI